MNSQLKKISGVVQALYEGKKIWDHENGCWVDATEENIERLWPRQEAAKRR